jgi:hypothetical protein
VVWLTSISGFVALALIAVMALIPYSTRWINHLVSQVVVNFRRAMGVHQVIGFGMLAVVVLHMEAAAGAGMMSRVNAMGLDIATIGLFVLLAQAIVGIMIRQCESQNVLLWKRVHWCLMLGILTLVTAHVYLNGMIIYSFF